MTLTTNNTNEKGKWTGMEMLEHRLLLDATMEPAEDLLHGAADVTPEVNAEFDTYDPGDANRDGAVNMDDLNIVAGNYGSEGVGWSGGDFDANGFVDVGDVGNLIGHWGGGDILLPDGLLPDIDVIPEPIDPVPPVVVLPLIPFDPIDPLAGVDIPIPDPIPDTGPTPGPDPTPCTDGLGGATPFDKDPMGQFDTSRTVQGDDFAGTGEAGLVPDVDDMTDPLGQAGMMDVLMDVPVLM